MLNISLLAAGHGPVDHVVPHTLHSEPLFSWQVGGPDYNNRWLNIQNGVYDFYITNHMVMTLVAAVLVVLVFAWVSRRVRPVGPGLTKYQTRGRGAQLFELLCTFIRDEVARPNLKGLTDKYIYYVWTIFFFILFANILGLIPFGPILRLLTNDSGWEHWGGTATSNLGLNLVLAMASFVAIIVIGIREQGVVHFLAHFNPVGWDWKSPMIGMGLMMFVLEWMGLMIKCTVLAMRLFGTMMAGHLVIAAFIALIFDAAANGAVMGYGVGLAVLFGGVVLTLLELFICALQAFIFTFLTVLFISAGAVGEHDHDHEENPLSDESQMDVDKMIRPQDLRPVTA
ncbi:ATP synthase subunit a [Rosistilla carotiformis]|uniref:ATP synthase subunit a n=1 Tax=Rosistilla carotiformis TaxID=2528017 RepID=A0A518JYD8_9BACT|nr:F0F1 ATP synthase subunit A [Rosistilla carotiformis]QDV70554.1 ATP synthase subunit a [Rosistilla carotiformis]